MLKDLLGALGETLKYFVTDEGRLLFGVVVFVGLLLIFLGRRSPQLVHEYSACLHDKRVQRIAAERMRKAHERQVERDRSRKRNRP